MRIGQLPSSSSERRTNVISNLLLARAMRAAQDSWHRLPWHGAQLQSPLTALRLLVRRFRDAAAATNCSQADALRRQGSGLDALCLAQQRPRRGVRLRCCHSPPRCAAGVPSDCGSVATPRRRWGCSTTSGSVAPRPSATCWKALHSDAGRSGRALPCALCWSPASLKPLTAAALAMP